MVVLVKLSKKVREKDFQPERQKDGNFEEATPMVSGYAEGSEAEMNIFGLTRESKVASWLQVIKNNLKILKTDY